MRNPTIGVYFLAFMSIFIILCSGKSDDQVNVDSEEYKQVNCILLDSCRECSYQELKQIAECKQNSFIYTNRCFYQNVKDENDSYDEMEYHACADKDTKLFKNSHYFFVFILIGFLVSMYSLNKKKYEIENQWFLSLKK
ncbi:hypothetical protein ABPG74_005129 [Tetrahymena malaccensis]